MNPDRIAEWVLRAGLAFAFLYPSISAISDPNAWIGYFPQFMRGVVPDLALLHGFGLLEAIIALWILSGKRIFLPSLAATLILLGIVTMDYTEFQVVFRDLSIAAIGLYLAIRNRPGKVQA